MPKINTRALRQVQDAVKRYEEEVAASDASETFKMMSVMHVRQFVNWLDDIFEPGLTESGHTRLI